MSNKGRKLKVASAKSPIVDAIPAACSDEKSAVELMERLRWDGMPNCPHCASVAVYQMTDRKTGERNTRYLWRCRDCKKQYTVKVGTVMEDSPIPCRIWAYAFWRACTSKKGFAALELQRQTGLSYKSAWFVMHRIREAMATDWTKPPKIEGTAEVDEVYIGGRRPRAGVTRAEHYRSKAPIVALLERGVGVRAVPVEWVDGATLSKVMAQHMAPTAHLVTDSAAHYTAPGKRYASHESVNHEAKEWVRGTVTTNRVEGFFGLMRRGLHGVYHSVSRHHLGRHASEFEFRFNYRNLEDGARMAECVRRSFGKRLTYRTVPDRTTA